MITQKFLLRFLDMREHFKHLSTYQPENHSFKNMLSISPSLLKTAFYDYGNKIISLRIGVYHSLTC